MSESEGRDGRRGLSEDHGRQPSYEVKLEVALLRGLARSARDSRSALGASDVLCLVISADGEARARVRRLSESGTDRVMAIEVEDVLSARSLLRSISSTIAKAPSSPSGQHPSRPGNRSHPR